MITGELRGLLADINWTEIIDHMQTSAGAIVDGDWLDAWHEAASNACNAIDAVHANLERENESLRRELDRTRGEWDYWESTHVELPKDADGVPVHIGDVMVYADGNTCPMPVVAIVPPAVFLTDDGPRYADMCRHVPDSWERIIEDATALGAQMGRRTTQVDDLVARCKALAGDAE
jgi:hypothetical protein